MAHVSFYLKVGATENKYLEGTVKNLLAPTAHVKKPSLKPNEIAIKMELEVPDEYFLKPTIEIKTSVPKYAHSKKVLATVEKEATALLEKHLKLKVVKA